MFDHIKIHDILEMDFDQPILEEDLKELGYKELLEDELKEME